jgi:hypothetical protein
MTQATAPGVAIHIQQDLVTGKLIQRYFVSQRTTNSCWTCLASSAVDAPTWSLNVMTFVINYLRMVHGDANAWARGKSLQSGSTFVVLCCFDGIVDGIATSAVLVDVDVEPSVSDVFASAWAASDMSMFALTAASSLAAAVPVPLAPTLTK